MLITGHKTESIFERYNIKDTADAEAALMKVGQYSSKKLRVFVRHDRLLFWRYRLGV